MKQIIVKVAVVFVTGLWTIVVLNANGSHDHTCKHEWKAAFDAEAVGMDEVENSLPGKTTGSFMTESIIPGGLQNFLLQ